MKNITVHRRLLRVIRKLQATNFVDPRMKNFAWAYLTMVARDLTVPDQ